MPNPISSAPNQSLLPTEGDPDSLACVNPSATAAGPSSSALATPPALEAANGGERRVRRRGLRVVEPLHPAQAAERLDAVRRVAEGGERLGDCLDTGQAALEHQRGCGERVGDVVRERSRHVGDAGDRQFGSPA